MDSAALIAAFVTLFVVIDPIGLSPVFVALTPDMDARQRRNIGARACMVGIVVLTLFGLFGEALLNFIGISMAAFRIAGGMLLFLTALDMLFERRTKRRSDQPEERPDPSVFPLATPLIAGPGSIASMILLVGEATNPMEIFSIHLVMVVVVFFAFLLFLGVGLMERVLGKTGINVITRLLGMLLAALSVQFVLDGLAAFGIGG